MDTKLETWHLTETQRNKFKPMVEEYIARLEAGKFPKVNEVYLDLTFQGINPHQLEELLQELGYTEDYDDRNGYDVDYWIYMDNNEKKKYAKRLSLSGCAMAFSLTLASDVNQEDVDDDDEDEEWPDEDDKDDEDWEDD